MINLLPSNYRQNITYARYNTKLLKWSLSLLGSIAGVAVIVVVGLFYIHQSTISYSAQLAQTKQAVKTQQVAKTQQKIQDISSSLKLVIQVLSREVLFSKLLKQIGSAIPANASLTDLKIGEVKGGIDLTAIASDYNTATQVQVNLQDPANKIFNKADIVSINCSSTNATNSKYPCTVTIRAQFAANNPFLFTSPRSTN